MARGQGSLAGRVLGASLMALIAGLLLAVAVHVVVVLLVPRTATATASVRIAQSNLAPLTFTELGQQGALTASFPTDRQFRLFACPFDLSRQPVAISSPISDTFWTLAIFDDASSNIYSLNDRLTATSGLNLVIVNASQLARLREIGAQELEKRIVVELDFTNGFALFRVFADGNGNQRGLQQFIDGMQCEAFEPAPGVFPREGTEVDDNRV